MNTARHCLLSFSVAAVVALVVITHVSSHD
jgi:hypothetical protein